ncbi:hypothetical protein CDD81_3103 [Ophiocordyceps australis]|uniref:Mitochondrial pyruvate carrier n=1 Tax=Ophiocordyceps australis TaxID=1399860 RepID=A0A2C5YE33_9HYPO|nr:hypothetical protein CDD81_3103 [Ophiocordyceps australis]
MSLAASLSRAAVRRGPWQSFARPRLGPFGAHGRRWQSGASGGTASQSWYRRIWESEVGVKTVHFWAPVMKWALVVAGISDFARPAEKLSFTQNLALTCTGLIWTRWCLIIKPKNYLLAAVNFFLGLVGITQLTRIGIYESSKKKSVADLVQDVKQDIKENVKP